MVVKLANMCAEATQPVQGYWVHAPKKRLMAQMSKKLSSYRPCGGFFLYDKSAKQTINNNNTYVTESIEAYVRCCSQDNPASFIQKQISDFINDAVDKTSRDRKQN
ncbi:hypothetical protein RF11_07061 [Thelohanellus kitauei]|uniref:Uncharacterized protein n=1 Tax=Thelohanellus kitauei TaxID=669202 RepID=A0A0C2IA64_THEKT|nr:hypothetical protein RF11_07061 [Thelohanellus kitauei]